MQIFGTRRWCSMKSLSVISLVATLIIICEAKGTVYFDGSLAETNVLPLKLECKMPYTFIYVGSLTFNGTAMSNGQATAATSACMSQSEQQVDKGGSVVTCFLTFGSQFSTDNVATVRAVYKCLTSKPSKAPGGKEWEQGNNLDRATSISKPDGTNRVKFQCSGVKDLVQVEKLRYEGEEDESNLGKYRARVKRECYIQSAQAVDKGSKVPLICLVQFDKADTEDLEVEYRCEDPPLGVGTKYGDSILI